MNNNPTINIHFTERLFRFQHDSIRKKNPDLMVYCNCLVVKYSKPSLLSQYKGSHKEIIWSGFNSEKLFAVVSHAGLLTLFNKTEQIL